MTIIDNVTEYAKQLLDRFVTEWMNILTTSLYDNLTDMIREGAAAHANIKGKKPEGITHVVDPKLYQETKE